MASFPKLYKVVADAGYSSSKSIKSKQNSVSKRKAIATDKKKKPHASESTEEPSARRKMPRRDAKEAHAGQQTESQGELEEIHHPCRGLTEFFLHDFKGTPQPFEMSEVGDLFISGLILPLDDSTDKKKAKGVRCEDTGRIKGWAISGYEDERTVIRISTETADYVCVKPLGSYKKFYDHFFAKVSACLKVYVEISISAWEGSEFTLDRLLPGVVFLLRCLKCFSDVCDLESIRDFVVFHGEFIYRQLLNYAKKTGQSFMDLPALSSLKAESGKKEMVMHALPISGKALHIGAPKVGDGEGEADSTTDPAQECKDTKLAELLGEMEYWRSLKMKRKNGRNTSYSSDKFYIKINEDEIANDYPLPSFYETSNKEADEYIVFEDCPDTYFMDDWPRSKLHNWALYNSDLRLVSLELLPLKPCADIDVTVFGSGVMTSDDGSGYNFDTDVIDSSSSGPGLAEVDGTPIYLSAIKEWKIEFGSYMVFISIRTDMAWYRLGQPSKLYAPWYEPVLKTVWLGKSILILLKKQLFGSWLSFGDVIKKLSELNKSHPAYVSSDAKVVERYVVVHGQIILQQFSEFPVANIRKCAFVTGLSSKMEERHHTEWRIQKKKLLKGGEQNLNPIAYMAPAVGVSRKAMQATATRLINRIWGKYYSNYSPEEPKEAVDCELNDDEAEEQEENDEDDSLEENLDVPARSHTPCSTRRHIKLHSVNKEMSWDGKSVGKTASGELLFKRARVHGNEVTVGDSVFVELDEPDELPSIYFVEYMFEKLDGSKMLHGRLMQRGSKTVLGNAANEREVFLINECMDVQLKDIKESVVVNVRTIPWGHEHRKANADADKLDRAKAEDRKRKGLATEFYCKSFYRPEKGAFFRLPLDEMGLGNGLCHSCEMLRTDEKMDSFELDKSNLSFVYLGTEWTVDDFVYVSPGHFAAETGVSETFKAGRNVGLMAYVVCQVLEIVGPKGKPKQAKVDSTVVKVQRFFRPEDISSEKAYSSDIREIYYSKDIHTVPVEAIKGKCEVIRRCDIPPEDVPAVFDHIFFCEYLYDPSKGSLKQLPAQVKLRYSRTKLDDAASSKRKGKRRETEEQLRAGELNGQNRLATLDIFAGCGGLSEGLQHSGICDTKWAIEYEEPAGEAFKLNHPNAKVFIHDCNVFLRAVMQKCGDADDCISTPEASELAAKMDENELSKLPLPGQVDFINGGLSCQGFSGMNRFNQCTWSIVQCEMIMAFLSFADYYRPKYFLLENARNFVSFNQKQTFRFTVASLLEMGYQVRFGILEAGAFGVPQPGKRLFIWAASPEEVLPDWPEPMHVSGVRELKIALSENSHYAAVRSTSSGAPFRSPTVRDTIGDLPAVANGASKTCIEYQDDAVSWFQKKIRGNTIALSDHISKEMNELNHIRCQKIPKRPAADWRDLPDEKVKLSNGQHVDLIPWFLPNTAHNQFKGLFGRLVWDGNFPTSITDPQPMGKVGMCFHPDQDRIVTVRECARSLGFPDSYQFYGNILHKHSQIGNAVPPPLAYALGRKLKEAV